MSLPALVGAQLRPYLRLGCGRSEQAIVTRDGITGIEDIFAYRGARFRRGSLGGAGLDFASIPKK